MPIDKELISKKLEFLNRFIASVENMDFSESTFIEDSDVHDLVVFRMQQAVETCIDIAVHIIAQSDLPRKETAKDAFLLLGQNKIIGKDISKRMGKAADFRNRIVHGYNDFDYSLLYRDYKENIKDLREYGSQILKYLKEKA